MQPDILTRAAAGVVILSFLPLVLARYGASDVLMILIIIPFAFLILWGRDLLRWLWRVLPAWLDRRATERRRRRALARWRARQPQE